MDQRYVETVRACKVLMRNLERLEEEITPGQRKELHRLIGKVQERLAFFLNAEAGDEGLWVGEE